jgi:hypothetical protein
MCIKEACILWIFNESLLILCSLEIDKTCSWLSLNQKLYKGWINVRTLFNLWLYIKEAKHLNSNFFIYFSTYNITLKLAKVDILHNSVFHSNDYAFQLLFFS